MKGQRILVSSAIAVFLLALAVGLSQAQGAGTLTGVNAPLVPEVSLGTGFTYQGQLKDTGGTPINDTCDFKFSLWDAESGGAQVGSDSSVTGADLADGYFTLVVNGGNEFGADAFAGDARWLQIAVKCGADPDYTDLSPRQAVTAAPYARSLRPGAIISGTAYQNFKVKSYAPTGGIPAGVTGGVYVATDGVGVYGHNPVNTAGATGAGVWGRSWAPAGAGVKGTGLNGAHGMYGEASGGGVGLYGVAPITGTVGVATDFSGDAYGVYGYGRHGVYGKTDSLGGRGVYGYAATTDGYSYGVYGESDSNFGRGVYGHATATSGGLFGGPVGVYGRSDASSEYAIGVHGYASAGSGATTGVYGESDSTAGHGVYGHATAANGTTYGVEGVSDSGTGRGVFGHATATSGGMGGGPIGVYGQSDASSDYARGVYGYASAGSGATSGVYGKSDSPAGYGVYGYASAGTSGATSGVYGKSDSPEGYGVYGTSSAGGVAGKFETDSSMTAPQVLLHEVGDDYARLTFQNDQTTKYWTIAGYASATDANARLNFYNSSTGDLMSITGDGKVGIGAGSPDQKLVVNGGSSTARIAVDSSTGNAGISLRQSGTSRWAVATVGADGDFVVFEDDASYGRFYIKGDGSGNVGIGTSAPSTKLDVVGTAAVNVLQIRGGSDLAERFEVGGEVEVEPGTLMVIDDEHPGQLKPSELAYDTRVAGIVSGAGGVEAGLTLHQEGVMEGDALIAIAGRVYVKAEALSGPIRPGDLLTSSSLPGYAMKASDRARAPGAIIGKAMSSLESGTGLVLVLVSLQ